MNNLPAISGKILLSALSMGSMKIHAPAYSVLLILFVYILPVFRLASDWKSRLIAFG